MINSQAGIGGRFRLMKKDASTGKVTHDSEFNNVILSQFLNQLNNQNLVASFGNSDTRFSMSFCAVGDGTTAPDGNQTGLENELAITNANFGNPEFRTSSYTYDTTTPGSEFLDHSITIRYTFDVGAVVGTIAEIGIRNGSLAGNLFMSRALIEDQAGNPTTITVLATEQLIVDYTLRSRIPLQFSQSVQFRAGEIDEYNGTVSIRLIGNQATGTTSQVLPWELAPVHSFLVNTTFTWYVSTSGATNLPGGVVPSNTRIADAWTRTLIANQGRSTIRIVVPTNRLNDQFIGSLISTNLSNPSSAAGHRAAISFSPSLDKDVTEQLTVDIGVEWFNQAF